MDRPQPLLQLARFLNFAQVIAQHNDTRPTVVIIVCLIGALLLTTALIEILQFLRYIIILLLFHRGHRIYSNWGQHHIIASPPEQVKFAGNIGVIEHMETPSSVENPESSMVSDMELKGVREHQLRRQLDDSKPL